MKSNINWKGVLISVSVLILFIGTYRLATGNISFPYNFTGGTPAVASQVNDNFSAINNRQTASASSLAGTYKFEMLVTFEGSDMLTYQYWNGSGMTSANVSYARTCTNSSTGNVTLTSGNDFTVSGSSYFNCTDETEPLNESGKFSVNADGYGSFDSGLTFQASKDLNTILLKLPAKDNSIGIAIRQ